MNLARQRGELVEPIVSRRAPIFLQTFTLRGGSHDRDQERARAALSSSIELEWDARGACSGYTALRATFIPRTCRLQALAHALLSYIQWPRRTIVLESPWARMWLTCSVVRRRTTKLVWQHMTLVMSPDSNYGRYDAPTPVDNHMMMVSVHKEREPELNIGSYRKFRMICLLKLIRQQNKIFSYSTFLNFYIFLY